MDIDIREQMKKDLDECPKWIVEKSVSVIQKNLSHVAVFSIKEQMREIGDDWWVQHHFATGMSVRNLLRKKVCLDGALPSGNWDDYYVQMIELSIEDE